MKLTCKKILACLLALLLLCGCAACTPQTPEETLPESKAWLSNPLNVVDDKYRTFYEIFVYSFYDSNGDGIGDLKGVQEKLDYLNDGDPATDTDLGINGIWLMPIMPSPTYHKYDTTNYKEIDPKYGTLEDFKALLDECHKRGINVIIDLAMNHSSTGHPWFLEACKYIRELPAGKEPDPAECPYVAYYNFKQNPSGTGYSLVPGSTKWFYECQFWSGMPDLNLNNPAVRKEFEEISKFWLDMGVDGFRLDAVKEFVTGAHKNNVEILRWFNDYVKSVSPDCYLVCECWVDVNTYAQYYASGVDSMFDFHFGQSGGVIAGVLKGSKHASTYAKAMANNEALYAQYHTGFINAPFYTNHDMGRTAGYYAGDTSAAQTKMGNAMNLLMTGNVFLYYGEELGMKGSGKDENKRAPMYWSKDASAPGMTLGPAGMDPVKHKFDSLAEQQADESSVYNYVKQAIKLRNQQPAIARGKVTFHESYSTEKICVFSKTYESTELLLVLNPTAEAITHSLEGLTVQGKAVQELSVLGELLTGADEAICSGNSVTMPPFSILVLGAK